MDWHYVKDGQRQGPVDDAGLEALLARGEIDDRTLIWNETMTEWRPYGQIARASDGQRREASVASMVMETAETTCAECHRSFPIDEMVAYGTMHVCAECKPLFFQKLREGAQVGSELNYAGFWVRFGAKVIDGILLYALQYICSLVLSEKSVGLTMLLNYGIPIVYATWMNGKYSQTLGKMACGLKIVRPDGAPLTYGRAFGRHFAELLSSLIFGIGYIMAAFDEEKRALHDRICDTRVIRIR